MPVGGRRSAVGNAFRLTAYCLLPTAYFLGALVDTPARQATRTLHHPGGDRAWRDGARLSCPRFPAQAHRGDQGAAAAAGGRSRVRAAIRARGRDGGEPAPSEYRDDL